MYRLQSLFLERERERPVWDDVTCGDWRLERGDCIVLTRPGRSLARGGEGADQLLGPGEAQTGTGHTSGKS